VESFHGKLRDELINRVIFYTLREAQVLIECRRMGYIQLRPHSASNYRPPAPQAVAPIMIPIWSGDCIPAWLG
jgi:putative transposase